MAPRRRPRVRNTRMCAAIDAMGRMGFEERIVRAKVNELLKVYDEDHGWPFIEDNAYMLLIEALITPSEEKAEGSGEEDGELSQLQNDSTQEEEAPAATTSNVIADSEQIGHVIVQAGSESVKTEAIQNVAPSESFSPSVTSNMERDPPRSEEGNGNNWKDIRLDRSSAGNETAVVVSKITDNLQAQIPAISPSSSKDISVQPAITPSSSKVIRRPCYGWLDYDQGELDFVYLTPAESHTAISSDGKTSKRIRRKSRWDLTPDDL